MQIHEKSNIFSCRLDLSVTPENPQPIFFCRKSKIKLSCPILLSSRHQLTVSLLIFKTTGHVSALGIPGSDVSRKSIGTKGSCSAAELESKSSLFPNHSFQIYRFRYQVLYTSFESQIKCTSNIGSALSVTVQMLIQLQLFSC